MGKGYNNFMSKKAFHPGSYANQKRIHEAEAKAEAKKKHDEETLAQYQKEQELFNQKSLVSKQSKEKLSLNFMYEAPPGVPKEDEKVSDKLEWKGSSGKASAHSSTSKSDTEPTICLEWKRDRPMRKPAPTEHTVKKEPKKEPSIKTEPSVKRELKTEPEVKKEPKTERSDRERAEIKRIKKER